MQAQQQQLPFGSCWLDNQNASELVHPAMLKPSFNQPPGSWRDLMRAAAVGSWTMSSGVPAFAPW
eukprot:1153782-Pelagomonas_calceolata.AAC.10